MTEKTAWGYVRLSQEGRDTSLEDQKQAIREYADENNIDLLTTRNEGDKTSGFDSTRPEYSLLREKIRDVELDAVIVRDRARLSRDFDDRLSLITDFRMSGVEWHVIEAGGKIDLQDVQTAGMECLHAMMDHVKKKVEITRAKEATKQRLSNGCYHGTPPLGLQFADDNCHLEKNNEEWDTVCAIIEDRENGQNVKDIAAEKGVSTATVSRISNRGLDWYEEKLGEFEKR